MELDEVGLRADSVAAFCIRDVGRPRSSMPVSDSCMRHAHNMDVIIR